MRLEAGAHILTELKRHQERAASDADWWLKRYGRTGNLGLAIAAHKSAWLKREIIPAIKRIIQDPTP